MSYWPWWLGGLALAAVPVVHWVLLGRMMAVSGRYTAFVNRLRFGNEKQAGAEQMSREEMIAALRAATEAEFGSDAVAAEAAPGPASGRPTPARWSMASHVTFLGGLLLGGLASALLAGALSFHAGLRGGEFVALVGRSHWLAPLLLVGGGMLVGFGTRMAGGCTSGHGLCGVSRFQRGSLLATVAFFATGVVTSLLLGALM